MIRHGTGLHFLIAEFNAVAMIYVGHVLQTFAIFSKIAKYRITFFSLTQAC